MKNTDVAINVENVGFRNVETIKKVTMNIIG